VVSAYTKLFLRAKPLNDLVRCMVVTNEPQSFYSKLNDWVSKNGFSYWFEDDTKKTTWKTLKIYLYNASKSYKGKIVPLEIQVTSPRLWFFTLASGQHYMYELRRLEQFARTKEYYEKYAMDPETLLQQLKNNNIDLYEEYNLMKAKGGFIRSQGTFSMEKDNLHIDGIPFRELTGRGQCEVIHGKLFLSNCGYFWTNSKWDATKNWDISSDVHLSADGEVILAFSPVQEVFGGDNKAFTVCVTSTAIWIRSKMFNEQHYWNRSIQPPNTNILVQIRNKKITVVVNGKPVNLLYNYPFDTFHLGIINFAQFRQKDIYYTSAKIQEVHS